MVDFWFNRNRSERYPRKSWSRDPWMASGVAKWQFNYSRQRSRHLESWIIKSFFGCNGLWRSAKSQDVDNEEQLSGIGCSVWHVLQQFSIHRFAFTLRSISRNANARNESPNLCFYRGPLFNFRGNCSTTKEAILPAHFNNNLDPGKSVWSDQRIRIDVFKLKGQKKIKKQRLFKCLDFSSLFGDQVMWLFLHLLVSCDGW
jgi:hypothetical protein